MREDGKGFQARAKSLLARDINWMETNGYTRPADAMDWDPYSLGILTEWKLSIHHPRKFCSTKSLLARDINWMETLKQQWNTSCMSNPYSLGILTEWKLEQIGVSYKKLFKSLLARDINWMETQPQSAPLGYDKLYPYSLGILTEWKRDSTLLLSPTLLDPYSLGILTEWKPNPRLALSGI